MQAIDIEWLDGPNERIAFQRRSGSAPTIVFLPGYMSDMDGAKAQAVDRFAERQGVGCLRFDYSGTGSSEGAFDDGTLSRWLDESLAVMDQLTHGPLILAGSSMGGWLALKVAQARPQRVSAILGIATAPDFTEWAFSDSDREQLQREGRIEEPQPDGSPGRYFTRRFWESGQGLRLLGSSIAIDCPVRLIHGDQDEAVPLDIAQRLVRQLRSADVQLTIVKGGGHRLSATNEIDAILNVLAGLLETVR